MANPYGYGSFRNSDILLCVVQQFEYEDDLYDLHLVNKTFYHTLYSPLYTHLAKYINSEQMIHPWLHEAVSCNWFPFAKRLLEHGTNPSINDICGQIALHWLATSRCKKVLDFARLLIDSGTNINAADDMAETALVLAATSGKLDLVKLLLDNGADPNLTPVTTRRCLGHVVSSGKWEVFELLANHGAQLNETDSEGLTLLHCAAKTKNVRFVRRLLEHGLDVNAAPRLSEKTPLWCAVSAGNEATVKMLLENGASTARPFFPTRLLQLTMRRKGQGLITKILLDHIMDVHINSRDGLDHVQTVLHDAARLGRDVIVRMLIERGANVNLGELHGRTPLMYAAASPNGTEGHLDAMRQLLESGADIKATDTYGRTALIDAAINAPISVVRLLLDHGANADAKDNFKEKPSEKARMRKLTDMVELLRSHEKHDDARTNA